MGGEKRGFLCFCIHLHTRHCSDGKHALECQKRPAEAAALCHAAGPVGLVAALHLVRNAPLCSCPKGLLHFIMYGSACRLGRATESLCTRSGTMTMPRPAASRLDHGRSSMARPSSHCCRLRASQRGQPRCCRRHQRQGQGEPRSGERLTCWWMQLVSSSQSCGQLWCRLASPCPHRLARSWGA